MLIPDLVPHLSTVERQLLMAIRAHDQQATLALMESTPEVVNNIMDLFPLISPEDLIRTAIKSDRLLELMIYHYPPLPMNLTHELSPTEKDIYRSRLIQVLGKIPKGILKD